VAGSFAQRRLPERQRHARESARSARGQIWPVVDALAANGFYYIDLHAGNVMVDEALENAWLIDFEGAITVAEMAEETTTEQLSDAVAAQKARVEGLILTCCRPLQ
jgi:hypothetical protein